MTPITIRAARAGLEWTQRRLASEADIHPQSVARWERTASSRKNPETPATLKKMQAAFARHGVTVTGQGVSFKPLT